MNKINRSILSKVDVYATKLADKSENEFQLTPPMGGWSHSEVFSHIFDSSLLSLRAIQKCAAGEGEPQLTKFSTKLVLFLGMLPPGKRYKVPKRLADRVKKIDVITAKKLIDDFRLQLQSSIYLVENGDQSSKIEHPRLGYLNAKQWLRFIEIHLNHHLKQLSRIEKQFDSSNF